MVEKRLNEIAERKNAIKTELENADVEQLRALNEEVDKLNAEEEQLRARVGLSGKLGSPEPKEQKRGGAGSDAEQRGRELRQKRAVTISTNTIIQAKKTGGVRDNLDAVPALIGMVRAEDCRGMGAYQVGYEKTGPTAQKAAENTELTESSPAFGYADIVPVTLATYSTISREVMKLSDADYYDRVQRAAFQALYKKVAEYIVNSDAASNAKFVGIKAAGAIDTSSDVEMSGIDETTLRKIALNYGGDDSIVGNAVLILNRADLIAFGDVRGTNEKKAVYEITPDQANPNTGVIKDGGLSVRYVLNKNLDALSASATAESTYCMIYGVPTCYELGIFSDFNVTVAEEAELKRRMIAVLGEVMIGGNVTVYNGFVRVKKVASA